MDLIERKQRFCIKWEIRRKRKWKTIFLYSIPWCIVMSLTFVAITSHFKLENVSLKSVITPFVVFGVGGLFVGIRQFNQIEKRFLILKDELAKE